MQRVYELLSYDPLVSDAACQNRAVFLVDIARRILARMDESIRQADLAADERLRKANLAADEIIRQAGLAAIEACNILTKTKQSTRNPIGYIDKEVTEYNQLPEDLREKMVADKSNGLGLEKKGLAAQKRKIVAYFKSVAAEAAIRYLQQVAKVELVGEYNIYESHEKRAYFTLEDISIPILPLYISAKMLLQYLAKNNVPIVVNFTRVRADETSEVNLGSATFCYRSLNGNDFTETTLAEEEPVIIADMFSFIGSKYQCSADFLAEDSFEQSVASFKTLGIAMAIMLAAAAHAPYTAKTKLKKKYQNDPSFNLPEEIEDVPPQPVNLNECSAQEFKSLRATANRMGFFQRRLMVDHVYPGMRGPSPAAPRSEL